MTQTVLLGDLVEVVRGISYRSADYAKQGEGLPFVNLKCVGRGGGFRQDGIKYYKGDFRPEQNVQPGDILIANTDLTQNREVIGSPIIMPDIGDEACFSLDLSKLVVKDDNKVDQQYLYYFLKSPAARSYMLASSNGSTVMHLSVKSIPKMSLDLPDIATQKKIADILGSLDEKIELNCQMSHRLEQMGQALFRHHFIDNPEAEKWEVIKLGDKVTPRRGKSLQSRDMRQGAIPVVSGGLNPAGTHDESNTTAPVVTVSASGANAGYTALWGENVWSADSSFIDSTITPNVYFYYIFMSLNQKRLYEMQTGSGQPHIYPKHIELLEMPNAPNELILEFNNEVAPYFEKLEENKKQTQTLTTLRDTLLPKLISGEIEV